MFIKINSFVFQDNFSNIKSLKNFESLNKELDRVYDHLEKHDKI